MTRIYHASCRIVKLWFAICVHALERAAELRPEVLVYDPVGAFLGMSIVLGGVIWIDPSHNADYI